MQKFLIALIEMLGFTVSVNAQVHFKKDGTPDMRYKENKQMYGNSYSQPSYSQPSYNYSQPTQTYKQPTYSQPT